MKISKKNLMAFVKNHAYGEEVLGKGITRSQTINSPFVEFMFGERVGEIRMLCQEDVYAVISLELISDESLAVFESLEEFNDFISIFFSIKRSKGDHLDMIDFFENDIIVDQIVINPSDCKTLVTMKYGIITEAFILYK
jgi:hypothetical protein